MYPGKTRWRASDLRKGTEINRNRDMDWVRTLEKNPATAASACGRTWSETPSGFSLMLTDEDGNVGSAEVQQPHQPATDAAKAEASLREQLGRFGATVFAVHDIALQLSQPWFVPASVLNALRRDAVADLEAAAPATLPACRATPVEPRAPPRGHASFLGNVFQPQGPRLYARHGVKVIAAAYEAHEEEGEVSP